MTGRAEQMLALADAHAALTALEWVTPRQKKTLQHIEWALHQLSEAEYAETKATK